MEHFFFSNSGGDLRSDAHQSQIIGGDANVDHTQIIGGIYPPIPPGFRHPWPESLRKFSSNMHAFKRDFSLISRKEEG